MFTGQRLGSGSNFFKIVKGITLHWAPVSILYETGIPFEGRVIGKLEFSFLIWLICAEFRILTVSLKKFIIAQVGGFIRFVLFSVMYFFTNTWAANFEMVFFIADMTDFSISWTFASGMWTIAKFTLFYKVSCVLVRYYKSHWFWLQVLWLGLFSFFLKILSMSTVGWDCRILRVFLRVSLTFVFPRAFLRVSCANWFG